VARIELFVALVVLVLEIHSLITCILTPESEVRGLPKALWIVLIVLLPLLGSALWLGVGRPARARRVPRPATPSAGAPAVPPPGYSALPADERIRRREEDLRRLEQESGEDGPTPRG
jgi:hypothetical protein